VESTDGAEPQPTDVPGTAAGAADRVGRLETIFELAPVGIGIVDFEGRTGMTNEVLRRSLGYAPEEFAAMPFAEFSHPGDLQANLDLFAQMTAGEIDHFQMEKRFIRKDGGILWVDLTASLVRDADGNPDYVIGMTQDISERKRLESELRGAEERYRLLVERVPAVVYVAEPGSSGSWSYVSPQIERMLGFTAQEWMADPEMWFRQIHPDDQVIALGEEDRILRGGMGVESPPLPTGCVTATEPRCGCVMTRSCCGTTRATRPSTASWWTSPGRSASRNGWNTRPSMIR